LPVGAAQFLQLRARNAAAAQTDHVQSHQIVDIGHGERDDIGAKRAHSCNHSAFSDAAELMHRGKPAEKYVVADRYVTAQRYIIRKRNPVTDATIMPDMASDHEKAALPYTGHPAAVFRSGIHRGAFADVATRSDNQPRRPPAVMNGLRRRTERGEGIDDGGFADGRDAADVNVGDEPHAVAKLDIRPDDAIRPDFDAIADACPLGHARGWIDRHLFLDQIGAEYRLGDHSIADLRFAAVPPHVAAMRGLAHVIFENVAGAGRFAKLRLVDGEKKHRARFLARRHLAETK